MRRSFVILLVLLAQPAAAQPAVGEWAYRVRPGDNPWSLTERLLSGLRYWPALRKHNQLRDATRIPPGTVLRIPVAWLRPEAATAQVLAGSGRIELMRAGQPAQALAPGSALRADDVVRTATDASVEMQFADGSKLRLLGDSELRVRRHVQYANTDVIDTQVQLLRGRSEAFARRIDGSAGRFEIETPAAVTSVRGTHFRVSAADAQAATEVLDGRVGVANEVAGVALGARTGTVAEAGRAPPPPIPLLAPPDLASMPPVFERADMVFSLPPLTGAQRYRLQIADSAEFTTLRHDLVSATPALRAPPLPDGDYHLRVRGIDEKRLEGLDAVARVRINAMPQPPIPLEPARGALVVEPRPRFRWAQVADAGSYRFELAREATFAAPLVDRAGLTGNELTVDRDLEPGNYFWRVTAADGAGRGPIGQAQSIRRVPPAPAAQPPVIGDAQLALQWAAGAAGERYRVQLATDEKFTKPLFESTTAETQAVLERPQPGTYFARVQTLYADGAEGPYGGAQRIEVPAKPPSPWWLVLPVLLILAL